jgi:hypothetical protein
MPTPTWGELQFAVYTAQAQANNRGIVVTEQVPADQYWCVLFYDAMNFDINLQSMAHWLLQPQSPLAKGPIPANLQASFNNAKWELNFLSTMIRVSDGGDLGSPSINYNDEVSQQNSVKSPSSLNKIIVPPLWYFALVETTGAVSGAARTLAMRMLFLRLPVGCHVPPL